MKHFPRLSVRNARGVVALAVSALTAPTLLASSASGAMVDPPSGYSATRSAPPLVSIAGDIACGTNIPAYNDGYGTATQCHQRHTSKLIHRSDAVWTLGDHVYSTATTAQLKAAYKPTWGRMKTVTYPTPGDHDYGQIGGAGYFSYFGTPRYYSFKMRGWHVISLNSEINHAAGSGQVKWLKHDLASTTMNCIAAYWGTPRWTSGSKAPGDTSFGPFLRALYAARADLVLSGDTHNYERFAKQTPAGDRAAHGIREFVVGTGGRSLVGFPHVQRHSQARAEAFGVLRLRLRTHSYHWRFINETRAVLDSGSGRCN